MAGAVLEKLLRRDDMVVAGALGALILLAWGVLLAGAGTGMDPAAMSGWFLPLTLPVAISSSWTPLYWLIAFFMWAIMMVAMMLPSASPMVLLYARVLRRAESEGKASRVSTSVAAFCCGYLALWILFAALAVALQFGLERLGALSALMGSRSVLLSGTLLISAGLYQLSPLKRACLKHCRSPAAFMTTHWQPGALGAWRMGLTHGGYCVGCCAVLMLLLFVGGVMNLLWIAGLTLFVVLEKLTPFGGTAAKAMAALLVGGGAALLLYGSP